MLQTALIMVFYYVFIAVVVRLLGKREIAQLGVLDLVIFLLIADVCAIGIENGDLTLTIGVIIIAIMEKLLSYVLLKFKPLRKIVDGSERIVILDGKLQYDNLKKELYTLDDILAQLRLCNVTNFEEVKIAILETDGRMSICRKNEDILLPVIQNGKIVKENLAYLQKNEEWIKKNAPKIEDVFCAFIVNDKLTFLENPPQKNKHKRKIK